MSNSLVLWLITIVVLTFLALFKRSVWGFSVYALTFFACPPFWGWGVPIRGLRWSLIGGIIFLAAVLLDYFRNIKRPDNQQPSHNSPRVEQEQKVKTNSSDIKLPPYNAILICILINYTFVHFFMAGGDVISADSYFLSLKFILLFYLIDKVIKTKFDLWVVLITLMIGITYIGYEVTINEAGHISAGRLESVGAPGASDANLLACLIVLLLPFSGAIIFVARKKIIRLLAFACTPFIFNLLLLCNSRGAFLSCFVAGTLLLLFSRKKELKISLIAAFLCIIASIILIQDKQIIDRFYTTFNAEEERDRSASQRMVFWQAALEMIKDSPLGTGGHSFKYKYGKYYLEGFGISVERRAIHNGYLNEACNWGVQGLFLKILLYSLSMFSALRASSVSLKQHNDYRFSYLGKALIAGMVAFLGATMFLDSLDSEWGLWMAAILVSYTKLIRDKQINSLENY